MLFLLIEKFHSAVSKGVCRFLLELWFPTKRDVRFVWTKSIGCGLSRCDISLEDAVSWRLFSCWCGCLNNRDNTAICGLYRVLCTHRDIWVWQTKPTICWGGIRIVIVLETAKNISNLKKNVFLTVILFPRKNLMALFNLDLIYQ